MGKCKKGSSQSDKHVSSLKPVEQIKCVHTSVAVLLSTDEQSSLISRNMRSGVSKVSKNDVQLKQMRIEVDDMLMDSSEHLNGNKLFGISEANHVSFVTNVINSASNVALGLAKCDQNIVLSKHVPCRTRKQMKQLPTVNLEKLVGIPMSLSSVHETKANDDKLNSFPEDRSRDSCTYNLQEVKASSMEIKLETGSIWPTTVEPNCTMSTSESCCAGSSAYMRGEQCPLITDDITKTCDIMYDSGKVAVSSSFCNNDMQLDGVGKGGDTKLASVSTKCEKHKSPKLHDRVKLCKQESHEINDTSSVQDVANSYLKNMKKGCRSLCVTGSNQKMTSCFNSQLIQSIPDKPRMTEAMKINTNHVTSVALNDFELLCTDSVDDPIPSKLSKLSHSSKRDIKYAKYQTNVKPSTVSHSDSVPTTLTRSKNKLPW